MKKTTISPIKEVLIKNNIEFDPRYMTERDRLIIDLAETLETEIFVTEKYTVN